MPERGPWHYERLVTCGTCGDGDENLRLLCNETKIKRWKLEVHVAKPAQENKVREQSSQSQTLSVK